MSAARPSFRELLSDKTLALMLALGFSSGLPILLVLGTQSLRLADAKVPLPTIGLVSWVGLFYSVKFFWAPVIDGFDIPGLATRLGRRRAWLLAAQLCVAAGLVLMGFADPKAGIAPLIAAACFTAFAAATQDIVVDGWRIDAASTERQGVMAATYNFGYKLATLCAGAGALYIADVASWQRAYLAMASLMVVGVTACLLSPRLPDRVPKPDRNAADAFIDPLVDLGRRYGALLAVILLLVALYRLPDFLTGVMAGPLYLNLGFTKTEIAIKAKSYGIWIGIIGAFAGGYVITRIGLMPSLLIGGIAAATSHLSLAWLAASGKSSALLALSVSAESFAGNFAGAALIAYMSSLTAPGFSASQYALLSSLYAILGKFIGGFSGYAVAAIGFSTFFALSSLLAIPIAILCLIVWRYQPKPARTEENPVEEVFA